MTELIFLVEEDPEGGWSARALGASIFTEADTVAELHAQVRDAVLCHFDEGTQPQIIHVDAALSRDEVVSRLFG